MDLATAIWGKLINFISTIVGYTLSALGIGYVSYQGIDTMLSSAKESIFSAMSGLSPAAIQLIGILKIGTCLNIIFSAIAARLILAGFVNGGMIKMVTKAFSG